ncbi:polysaccharide deacetylase family protein [Actinoplanes sp. NEAU-A12]|uniref:Polysaccharide deacetylase family protein n=1 Tax=Actinoplanes sandaracinus TaxID=3045177 RepID=A0ABT6WYD4_9ACTN|nr:polysaccharide deacetylase family protein [Actinoplanes sandaracinus]MDI6104755.1 polysaccharide deacetylase family protein [Actinoplanes sandaracinus]
MRTVAALLGMLSLACGVTFIAPPAQAAPLPSAATQSAATQSAPAQAVRRTVYLTFDDGPNAKWTPRYLDVLKKYDAKATFFTTGRNVKAYPGIVSRIDREGHLLANHTWSHPNLTRLSKADVKRELTRTQSALGRHRTACMRPPYGATNTSVRRWTKEVGLKTVLWDVDSRDWENSQTSTSIYTRVTKSVRDDSIVLMHDGGDSQRASLAALTRILPKLKSMGYAFEVLPNC